MTQTPTTQPKLRFSTTEQVLADPKFTEFLAERLLQIETDRDKVFHDAVMNSESSKAPQLKRSPYDFLESKNLLNPASIIQEQLKIESRTSGLCSSVRTYIEALCLTAARQTIAFYVAIDNPTQTQTPSI